MQRILNASISIWNVGTTMSFTGFINERVVKVAVINCFLIARFELIGIFP